MATSIPSRRFHVEPIETTTKSSKEMVETVDEPKHLSFAAKPIETTLRTHRHFAVEPTGASSQSSIEQPSEENESLKRVRSATAESMKITSKTHRRFAPEPIETTVKSSKDSASKDTCESKPPRKFAPQPIETSQRTSRRDESGIPESPSRSSRKKFADEWESQTAACPKREHKPRKFAPQLIGTARRSRRAGDLSSVIRPSDKTEATPLNNAPSAPANTPTFDYAQNPLFLEIQRATSPLNQKRMSRSRPSHHCFRVPDLEPIESSESEGSSPPSPTISSSNTSDRISLYKCPTRMRESVDDMSSGYLLELAAKAAEKQLREQAMAAFPNDDYHEPVDHFVDHDDEETAPSFREVNWDLTAMRQHAEKVEGDEAKVLSNEQPQQTTSVGGANRSPRSNSTAPDNILVKDVTGRSGKNKELERMRRDARPPMLGKDIRFPRCQSPEPARFDTTQGCDAVRIAMCYLSEQSQQAEKGESLWCGQGNGRKTSNVPSLWSNASSRRPSKNGLWAGSCVNTGNTPPRGPTGILTPKVDIEDPFSPRPTPSASLLPPTPPASNADFACIDEKLTFALSIEEDYGDDFVTQVYNYLSLGYPSMARPFDGELSKISQIPIEDLRQDDHLAKSRGYIRLGEDGNLKSTDITEECCMRWRALRIYIREWAKQHPGMAGEAPMGGMGTAVRRGSWAL